MQIPDDLKRGDALLYFTADITDAIIAWKEGDSLDRLRVSHIEIYAGSGSSWASRNGIGVALYPFRATGLQVVRRPVQTFDAGNRVDEWFMTINGASYGWKDILATAGIRAGGNGVDCAHFAALLMQVAACPQFSDTINLAQITPFDFVKVRESVQVYP